MINNKIKIENNSYLNFSFIPIKTVYLGTNWAAMICPVFRKSFILKIGRCIDYGVYTKL